MAAPAANAAAPEAVRAALAAELDAIRKETGFPGMTAAVVLPDGQTIAASSGLADIEAKTPMRPDQLMPAGSIGKTFVAATALQLAAEGKLSLDAPVAKWLGQKDWYANVPNGSAITPRMLLNHSSGIEFDYITSDPILPLFMKTFGPDGASMDDQGFVHADIMRAMAGTKPQFPAGTGFAYTDTNYSLMGLLIEDVSGHSVFDEAARRFIAPLGLARTVPTPRASPNFAAGYEPDETTRLPGFPEKLTTNGRLFYDPALEWTGGGYASTSKDLAKWAWSLYGRRALSSAQVDDMIASANPHVPAELGWRYGLGVQLADDAFGRRMMHGGYIPGYSSYMEYLPRFDMALAFQANTRSGFGKNRSYADRLWRVVLAVTGHTDQIKREPAKP